MSLAVKLKKDRKQQGIKVNLELTRALNQTHMVNLTSRIGKCIGSRWVQVNYATFFIRNLAQGLVPKFLIFGLPIVKL